MKTGYVMLFALFALLLMASTVYSSNLDENKTIVDSNTNKQYTEEFTATKNIEDMTTNYQAEFSDDDGNGIPQDATTHRLSVYFAGVNANVLEPYLLLKNDNSEVVLAKESAGGVINSNESLIMPDGYKLRLEDVTPNSGAIVSVLDGGNNIVKQTVISADSTQYINMVENNNNEISVPVHVFKVAPGYTFGAKWADISVLSTVADFKNDSDLNINGEDKDGYYVEIERDGTGGLLTLILSVPN